MKQKLNSTDASGAGVILLICIAVVALIGVMVENAGAQTTKRRPTVGEIILAGIEYEYRGILETVVPGGTWTVAGKARHCCTWSRCKAWTLPELEPVWLRKGTCVKEADGEYMPAHNWGWKNSRPTSRDKKTGR